MIRNGQYQRTEKSQYMPTRNLLYAKELAVNEKISIVIPTIRDILSDEDGYYGLVSMLTAMPIDYMVLLDDMGLDFSAMNAYDLFLLLFPLIQSQDTSLIFGDMSLEHFTRMVNEQNGLTVLVDPVNDIVIDRAIHGQIQAALRKIHHLEKNIKRPANEDARQYMLERARIKQKRRRKKQQDSALESMIVAMVNTEQYKYDFESTLGLSIYQFNESVRQIIRKIDFDNRMIGVYAGTVDASKVDPDDLKWIGPSDKK